MAAPITQCAGCTSIVKAEVVMRRKRTTITARIPTTVATSKIVTLTTVPTT